MRFIYIDSQGHEVNIPSVDALRLRIELGAIVDTTQFHDAGTGRWAPAAEHEIYRTLKRELAGQESEGFVAPPPGVGVEGSGSPAPDEPEASPESFQDLEPMPVEEGGEPSPLGVEEPDEDDGTQLLDLGVDFGLAPEELQEVREPEVPGEDEHAVPPEEVEDPWLPVPEGAEEAMEGPGDGEGEGDREGESGDTGAEGRPDESFLASPMDEAMGGAGDEAESPWSVAPHGMELEQSLADTWDGGPPPEGGDGGAGEEEEFQGWGAGDDGEGLLEEDGEPVPQEVSMPVPPPSAPRNAPPSRKLTRARTPGAERIALVVLLVLVVGAGAWYGWGYVSTSLLGFRAESEVELPEVPAELLPRVRQLAARASAEMVRGIAALPEREVIPAEPSNDWLAGVYLAGASEYPGVREYWESMRNFVIAARAVDLPLFREAFRREVEAANLTADDADLIRNRGIAGFMAAASDRRTVFDQLEAVADEALALHDFLLANEEDISFEPAAGGVSRDPVLEAVPASPELGEAMWERVGAITNALDALGYLDQIDTERLLGAFLEKLEATSIR